MRVHAHVPVCANAASMIQSFLCARVCVRVCVCVSQSRSRKPMGGLSRETAEIEVGNSHQKCPNQERCRQEPPCKGTEGNRGVGEAGRGVQLEEDGSDVRHKGWQLHIKHRSRRRNGSYSEITKISSSRRGCSWICVTMWGLHLRGEVVLSGVRCW